MTRATRADIYAHDEIAIVHAMNRTARGCCLMGTDEITGLNFDHRKRWIEEIFESFAQSFGIDLLVFALMPNHMHLVLRSRPDCVDQWDNREVARRWLTICPIRKKKNGDPYPPTEYQINKIVNNPDELKETRTRLSNISWWMRLVSQRIAQRANREDDQTGCFWQSRFKAVRLLDETAILACAAYVDLNVIRAAMAETLELSEYTSAKRRIEALKAEAEKVLAEQTTSESEISDTAEAPDIMNEAAAAVAKSYNPAAFLSPVFLDKSGAGVGPMVHTGGHRASDKGFLPMTAGQYIELLDWTARQVRPDKRGSTPAEAPPIFQRLGISSQVWCELVSDFGRLFVSVAGKAHVIESCTGLESKRRFKAKPRVKELLAS